MFLLNENNYSNKSIIIFFILVFALSWPYFIIASLAALGFLPSELVNLWYGGVSAPMLVAIILIYIKEKFTGIKNLFRKGFKIKIPKKSFFLPIFLLVPVVFILALIPIGLIEGSIAAAPMVLWLLPIMFVGMFFSALAEELGWRGYAFDRMQTQFQTFRATLYLGIIWVIWHLPIYIFVFSVPPFNSTPLMVLGQCLNLIGLEFVFSWIYINTDKSIFTVALTHNVYNMCTFFLPNFVPEIGAFITSMVLLVIAAVIVLKWFPKNKKAT